jgi:hypothetical protein
MNQRLASIVDCDIRASLTIIEYGCALHLSVLLSVLVIYIGSAELKGA